MESWEDIQERRRELLVATVKDLTDTEREVLKQLLSLEYENRNLNKKAIRVRATVRQIVERLVTE